MGPNLNRRKNLQQQISFIHAQVPRNEQAPLNSKKMLLSPNPTHRHYILDTATTTANHHSSPWGASGGRWMNSSPPHPSTGSPTSVTTSQGPPGSSGLSSSWLGLGLLHIFCTKLLMGSVKNMSLLLWRQKVSQNIPFLLLHCIPQIIIQRMLLSVPFLISLSSQDMVWEILPTHYWTMINFCNYMAGL